MEEYLLKWWNANLIYAFCLLMLSGQFYEKLMSVRERKIKLQLETVTYIATTKTVTCIITIEIVMCTAENTTCIMATEIPTCVISIKNCQPHNCCRNFHLHKCCRYFSLHNCNRNSHLCNWLQKLSLAEMVPVRDPFSYNKKI